MKQAVKKSTPRAMKAAAVTATETAPKTAKSKTRTATAPKAAKTKREPGPADDRVVFALRMSPEERDRLHAAAGSAKASHFARGVLVAFSNADEAGFRQLVQEAEGGRAKTAAKK